ncbi:dienelactone hydrolase [Arthrobacter stackebrandtii]|uniref:Dienelactone hydrolase n=1 Tax=Arthrobacter stackebrandtii TaxID=272161 RepID=A0ABS4YZN1_9MICC|nr:alpha/beta fold hydrolase [Arthrobacter stackebrandtii]MBP2414201.1 dienelactone hydrolase [Arthrobacter stackebrandtii]PYG98934.1 alpha/beta hydrolase [Arthrobacter stackebrandtii]
MATSTDLTWQLDGITMEGTAIKPDGAGPFPGVVLVAGSGPTDRDWCSPMLPGTNGSGRLFAEELANAGFASIRYDKRASGPHAMDNLPKLFGRMSMQSHLDELSAATAVLARLDFMDPARIAGFGNCEGTLHVLNYAAGTHEFPFKAAVLAAPPGRPIQDVLLAQLRLQSAAVPGGNEMMQLVEEATARYAAGEPMDPDPALPESVRQVLSSFDTPANLPFARELWRVSARDTLGSIGTPALVLIGGRDVQIDQKDDGGPLQQAASGRPNVTFVFPPRANHVFKEDVRTRAEVAASPGNGYNEPGTRLDPESAAAIIGWLRTTLA